MVKKVGSGKQSPKKLKIAPELSLVQSIMPMSEEDRARLEEDIRKNGIRHPIIVYRGRNNVLLVLAGWHRRETAIKFKIPSIPYDEIEASQLERREFCITENMSRRHLTSSQKRELIEFLLRMDPKKSNKAIAKETGSTKETVKAARDRLETGGEIRPLLKRKGADGKTYTTPGRKSYASSGITETFRKSDSGTSWSVDFSKMHMPTLGDSQENKVSRISYYSGVLEAIAESLNHKAMNEENKNRALQLIGEARATARIAEELIKALSAVKKKK